MELKYGWICPLCGKVLSPETKECDCYKQDKKEEILKKVQEQVPKKLEDVLKDFKWVKDWQTPYDDQPKFKFYTSGSSDPCDGCPSKGKAFCHCTLASKVSY